jgi:hypothetical protein
VYLDTSGALGSQFLKRDAFAVPALGSYGNVGFGAIRGFAYWTFDTAVLRLFELPGGGQRFELRVELSTY